MNSYIQLICLIVSFIYGIILYYSNKINYKMFKNMNYILKIIGSILYINNMALLYIIFLYYMNSGVMHIYFILFMILGYIVASVKKRK